MSDALVPAYQPANSLEIVYPIESLEAILQACDPGEALKPGDPRYMDLNTSRHGIGIAKFERAFRLRAPRNGYHHGLLCGHRGSGKSTELLSLQKWADNNGFLAVWEQVDVHFGMIDLDYSDVFLLAISTYEKDFSAELNRLLFRGCLLEYVQNNQPWFDVHPVLVDTEEFQHARRSCG